MHFKGLQFLITLVSEQLSSVTLKLIACIPAKTPEIVFSCGHQYFIVTARFTNWSPFVVEALVNEKGKNDLRAQLTTAPQDYEDG